jgi:DNA polymerase I-like protein with 3'-5' exonuclease and polymerase domains
LRLLEYAVAGQLKDLLRDIYASMGVDPATFNVNSRPQVGKRLLELGVPIEERTKGGVNSVPQVATGKDILVKYESEQFPFIKKLIMRAELQTQLTNYIRKMIGAVEYFGPIVRYAFNQLGAPTGRMSSGGEGKKGEAAEKGYVNVNVQSLPDHEKQPYLPNIRSSIVANNLGLIDTLADAFIAARKNVGWEPTAEQYEQFVQPYEAEEWVVVSIDFSQIEIRVAGNLSRERAWIEAYQQGVDIHQRNAQLAYADPTISKHDPRRAKGKTMSFAILYQAMADTVAKHGNISEAEAQKLIDTFLGNVPSLREWVEGIKRMAAGLGYVKTFFGRKRNLKHYFEPGAPRGVRAQGEREGVNHPVQGTAADIFKIACCRVWRMIRERGWTNDVLVMLWVHDEIVFRIRRSHLYEAVPAIKQSMEFPIADWPIPIVANPYVGWNLGTLYDYDEWVRMFPPETVGQHVVSWLPAAVYGDRMKPPAVDVEDEEEPAA